MTVFSTLLLSLVTGALSSNAPNCPTAVGSQCAASVTPTLTCDAANTCCNPAGCAVTCTDCTAVTLSGEGAAIGANINIAGDDNAMAITVSGENAAYGATITGEGFRTFDCTGEEGFTQGSLSAKPANEDVGLAVTCTAQDCCNTAAFDIDFAASFVADGEDSAYNVQFTTLRPLRNSFTIACTAGGACESGDFVINIDDCQGFDPWIIPSITCQGDDSCNGATFTFNNQDPDCDLEVAAFTCEGENACANVRVYTTGNVAMTGADCVCTTGTDVCTGAGSVPAGFCTSFSSTFSPTAAPIPTASPTPCPTTASPTTAAPTTAAPTTAAPTTAAPTTAAPTTAAPTTAAPTTAAPTTAAPTTAAPTTTTTTTTTAAPTTAAPTDAAAATEDGSASGDSDSSDDLAELEDVLNELNAAHANEEVQAQDTDGNDNGNGNDGLFGDDLDEDEEGTNYEMVISLSNEALEHLWAIVITFVVFNAICVWCYYNRFGGKRKRRFGDSLPSTV